VIAATTQIPRLEFLPTVHARAVTFAGCLTAGKFPRQSVLSVAEDTIDGLPDPNDLLTRILDEPLLARRGAEASLAGCCAEPVAGYGEFATACATLQVRMLRNKSTVSAATFNTHDPAWRTTLPGR